MYSHRFQQNDDGLHVVMEGRLKFAEHGDFRGTLDEIRSSQSRAVVIELSELEEIDSAGLGMLLLVRDVADDIKANVTLSGAQGQVAEMLAICDMGSLMTIR